MPRILPTFAPYKRPEGTNTDDWLATDANVLCVLDIEVEDGETGSATGIIKRPPSDERTFWVVTSPNEYYIPFVVIGIRHVKARRDGRYGLDDRTQHPQYFTEDFYWMSCIPRTVEERPYLRWTPTLDDCDIVAPRTHLRVLKDRFIAEFESYASHYSNEVACYFVRYRRNSHLAAISSHMVQISTRLGSVPMVFKHIIFYVAEFQAACLDIHGWLDWTQATEYSYERQRCPSIPVAPVNSNRMGAFTESIEAAQLLYERGVPVWLLRPSDAIITDGPLPFRTSIHSLGQPNPPQVVMDDFNIDGVYDPFPVICVGLPCTFLYQSMQRIGSRIVDLRLPTAIGLNEYKSKQAAASTGATRSQSSTERPAPYQKHRRKAPATEGALPALTAAQLARFKDPVDPAAPPSIPSWSASLALVDTTKVRVRKDKQHRLGFGFPDPTLLSKTTNRTVAVVAWLLSRMSHLTTLFNNDDDNQAGPELTSTHWTNLIYKLTSSLEQTRITSEASTPTSASLSSTTTLPSSSVSSAVAVNPRKWTPHFSTIFESALSTTNVYWMDYTFQLGSKEELEATLTPRFTSGVIWELYETNFRFELLFLDRTLASSKWPSTRDHASVLAAAQRDLEVRSVFARGDDDEIAAGYTLSQIPTRDKGLASFSWQERSKSLTALLHLMKSWDGCPSPLLAFKPSHGEQSAIDLERQVTQFYCQVFFDTFGRAAICPRRLPPSVIEGESTIAPGAAVLSTSLALASSSTGLMNA
ncbi:hypothetical protein BKA70DRAFT_1455010 [Coprinopsis sp. MPI-PUGE-AT-0042]|nr:hypothetical protein BKA70DRAFT_1455010 [Coprinopsis sp. MPI-PUGE-AT-0042]